MKEVYKTIRMANEYQSSKLCEAPYTRFEDQMNQLQVLTLPSMAKFNAGFLQCNQSLEDCVGPSKTKYSAHVKDGVPAESVGSNNMNMISSIREHLKDTAQSMPMCEVSKDLNKRELTTVQLRKWIGVLVTRKFVDGRIYLGQVVDYNDATQFYKVVYDDVYGFELRKAEEITKMVAPSYTVDQYLKCQQEKLEKRYQRILQGTQLGTAENMKTGAAMATATALQPLGAGAQKMEEALLEKTEAEANKLVIGRTPAATNAPLVETRRKASLAKAYVPLAFRETKKDEYIYY